MANGKETGVQNSIKQKLHDGKAIIGTIPTIDHRATLRELAGSDFDFLLIDTQHSPIDITTLYRMLVDIGRSKEIIVRVPFNETHLINSALDAGADGVIVPLTNTPEAVERAVQAAKFPPRGVRSWGPKGAVNYGGPEKYARTANDEVIVWPQVETLEAVENLDDILTIDGVDGIMIGPADLGWSMGFMPHEGMDEVDAMFQHVLDKCIEHGVPWGMFTSTYERAEKWLTRGGKIATVGADSAFLAEGLRTTEARVNALRDRLNV